MGFGGGEGKGEGGVQAGFAAQRLIQRLLSTVVYLSFQHLFKHFLIFLYNGLIRPEIANLGLRASLSQNSQQQIWMFKVS